MAKKKRKKLKAFLIVLLVMLLGAVIIVVPPMLVKTIDNSWSFSSRSDNPPKMIAHRGLSSLAPENTVPAFEAAVEYGFDGYEFDVFTTADGEWVVFHDSSVDGMTDGEGDISEMTFEQVRQLKIDSGNGIEEYSDLRVPTLEEALSVCENNDIFPVIELKSCDPQRLLALIETVEEKGLADRAVIIGFDREYLEICRSLNENIRLFLVVLTASEDDIDWCIENNAGIDFFYGCLAFSIPALSYAKENSVEISAWTVDNIVFEDIMVLFGVEYITTNKLLP